MSSISSSFQPSSVRAKPHPIHEALPTGSIANLMHMHIRQHATCQPTSIKIKHQHRSCVLHCTFWLKIQCTVCNKFVCVLKHSAQSHLMAAVLKRKSQQHTAMQCSFEHTGPHVPALVIVGVQDVRFSRRINQQVLAHLVAIRGRLSARPCRTDCKLVTQHAVCRCAAVANW